MLISFSAVGISAVSAEDITTVFVTISDANNKLVVVQEPIVVTDADNDGKLTINDTFILAHDKFYEGGSEAGYKSSVGQYGLSIDKLWGTENGGSYMYYVNHNMASGLTNIIGNGSYLDAMVFPDPANLDYHYSHFGTRSNATQEVGDE